MAWQVEFFTDERGKAPVEEYLTSLPVQHRAKMLALLKMLEQEGPSLPFPYSSQVRGKLRELRSQQGKVKLRILYFGDAGRGGRRDDREMAGEKSRPAAFKGDGCGTQRGDGVESKPPSFAYDRNAKD